MYTLPQLSYSYKDLEPSIDVKTMEIHHTKHHQAYVNNLNKAIEGLDIKSQSIEELLKNLNSIPVGKKDLVRNHGGGHANHNLYWDILTPGGSSKPSGSLLTAIEKDFGSFDTCASEVSDAAITHFGSGWGWLVVNKNNKLEAVSTANQDSPLLFGHTPIIGIDVWEHAYYLKYQNLRADYVKSLWSLINWNKVEILYEKAHS